MAEVAGSKNTLIREGLFEAAPGWKLSYRLRTVKDASATWVLLNGLGDDFTVWNPILADLGPVNTLQVDLRGQGKSLIGKLASDPDTDFRITMQEQATDLEALIRHLGLPLPLNVVGCSYGGGVALQFASQWPGWVSRLGLIVPFVIRLDKAFPLQRLWSFQWRTAKSFGLVPGFMAESVERHYENFLSHYMNHRYEKRLSEPELRRAAIELSHGIMQFDAFQIVERLPDESVFLLTSDLDTLVPRSLYREFWNRVPERKRGHWIQVPDGGHLLLEERPELVCDWLKRLNPRSSS
jgi:pimeloyl-ACP methyl ester carboxylesterase